MFELWNKVKKFHEDLRLLRLLGGLALSIHSERTEQYPDFNVDAIESKHSYTRPTNDSLTATFGVTS